ERVNRRKRLSATHLVTRLGCDDETDRGIDPVFHRPPSTAKRDDTMANGARRDFLNDAILLRSEIGFHGRRREQVLTLDDVRVTALCPNDLPEFLHGFS